MIDQGCDSYGETKRKASNGKKNRELLQTNLGIEKRRERDLVKNVFLL